jgi:hypothetical protein
MVPAFFASPAIIKLTSVNFFRKNLAISSAASPLPPGDSI